jgi:hypothetical protein
MRHFLFDEYNWAGRIESKRLQARGSRPQLDGPLSELETRGALRGAGFAAATIILCRGRYRHWLVTSKGEVNHVGVTNQRHNKCFLY